MAADANTRLQSSSDTDYANVFKDVFKADKTDPNAVGTVTSNATLHTHPNQRSILILPQTFLPALVASGPKPEIEKLLTRVSTATMVRYPVIEGSETNHSRLTLEDDGNPRTNNEKEIIYVDWDNYMWTNIGRLHVQKTSTRRI